MTESRLQQNAADRLAVRELIDRYHAAVNHRDLHLLRTLFTDDAVWEAGPPVNLRFEGRDGVIAGLRGTIGRQELLVQTSGAVVVTLHTTDEASVRSTLIEFGREAGSGAGWRAVAFYDDRARRDDDCWRFARRTLRVRYMEDVSVAGRVFGGGWPLG